MNTIGYIGLGKMGLNMSIRLTEKGWQVLAFDSSNAARDASGRAGVEVRETLFNLASDLNKPRTIWLMVPHGAVDALLDELVPLLEEGDTVIDGGNSLYEDSTRRAVALARLGINYLDAGVSGGPEGARSGACVMVGGDAAVFGKCEELFRDLSIDGGYAHVGASGAGHFVKMVHNGIEYGMMQSLAEGFALMRSSQFALDLAEVARLYNHGSVIESRLVGWCERGLREQGADLAHASGVVGASGEGAWTVETARALGVDAPAIEAAVRYRARSSSNPSFAGKILTMLRNQFGGHSLS